jgi:hypothetical protein
VPVLTGRLLVVEQRGQQQAVILDRVGDLGDMFRSGDSTGACPRSERRCLREQAPAAGGLPARAGTNTCEGSSREVVPRPAGAEGATRDGPAGGEDPPTRRAAPERNGRPGAGKPGTVLAATAGRQTGGYP